MLSGPRFHSYSPRENVNHQRRGHWPDVRGGGRTFFLGGLDFMNDYRLFRAPVYMKLKNVGPGVVADHIQGILSRNNLVPVDLCDEDGFAFRKA